MKAPDFAGIWRDDERSRAAYSEAAGIYRIVPRAIAIPSTTRAVQDLVRWSLAERVPLVPRGAGSAMPGSNVGDGVVVDLSALDGAPLEIDRQRFLAKVGASVTLGDLSDAALGRGLRMPVDPSSARWATCGGTVATNASGPSSLKYGPVRRWVHAIGLVTADGELIELERGIPAPESALTKRFTEAEPTLRLGRWRVASAFPKVRKNTAGYALDSYLSSGDLLDLVIGAEGTLGIVTSVTWRLEPIPSARAGVRAAIRDVRRLGHVVPALLSLDPARLEFLDASFVRFIGSSAVPIPRASQLAETGALLMVEFEGESEAHLATELERAVGILRPESLEVLVADDQAEVESLWAIRHAASPRLAELGDSLRSLQVIEDACVPVDRVGEYVAAVRQAAERHGVEVVLFGHAGDGNVHANLLPDLADAKWLDRVRQIYESVTQSVLAMGGSPSGEHGDGRLRAPLLERVYGWETAQLLRQIKRVFDPHGLFNPGVKIALPGADAFAGLKVGPDAVPVPDDIGRGLRWIERNAGYGTSRLTLADDPSSWSARATN